MTIQNKPYRKTAIIVGVLYIIGTISGILSLSFSGSIRNAENLLAQIAADETQIIIAAFFIIIMALALSMVPVMMYPVLKKHDSVLALGYVIFRGGLEGTTYILSTVSWLLLVPLSRAYTQSGAANAALLNIFGTILFDGKEIAAIANIIFCLGGAMLYVVLFRTKLVPRWLSGWGLLALVFYLASGLLSMFNVFDMLSPASVAMQAPLALQEMVLAVWLLVKGFNSVSER